MLDKVLCITKDISEGISGGIQIEGAGEVVGIVNSQSSENL